MASDEIKSLHNINLDSGTNNSQYLTVKEFSNLSSNGNCNDFINLQINIRSLTKNFDKLVELLKLMKVLPDLITISETKLNGASCLPVLPGYHFVNSNSKTKAGGVGIFVKSCCLFNVVGTFNLNAKHCEEIWIELKTLGNKQCILGAIYRHPKSDISEFSDKLECCLSKLNKSTKNYFFS